MLVLFLFALICSCFLFCEIIPCFLSIDLLVYTLLDFYITLKIINVQFKYFETVIIQFIIIVSSRAICFFNQSSLLEYTFQDRGAIDLRHVAHGENGVGGRASISSGG